ncbi:14258_t:CDS:1 [Ambispora leptoticha]|uniref:14258_t:CDS:1 n=1 Tax=Ambispora leptoticha TaxID=144679 RepID=A0A9N9CU89_9GLOM|nr:14258_t:CDS:1 [Ambispora leptoticha]
MFLNGVERANRRSKDGYGPIRNTRSLIIRSFNEVNLNTESKIIVSNLGYKVSEADLYELFGQMIGPVCEITLDYDKFGRFKGSAIVVFARGGDAAKAVERFRGVTLDGQELKIEVIVMPRSRRLGQRIGSKSDLKNEQFRGGRGRGRSQGPVPTKDQLDAELDEYMQIEVNING